MFDSHGKTDKYRQKVRINGSKMPKKTTIDKSGQTETNPNKERQIQAN